MKPTKTLEKEDDIQEILCIFSYKANNLLIAKNYEFCYIEENPPEGQFAICFE